MVTRKTAMALLLMFSVTAAPAASASQAPRFAQMDEQLLDVIGVVAPVAVALGMAGVAGMAVANLTSNTSSSPSRFEEGGTNEASRNESRPQATLSTSTAPEAVQSSSLETFESVKLQPGKRKVMLD